MKRNNNDNNNNKQSRSRTRQVMNDVECYEIIKERKQKVNEPRSIKRIQRQRKFGDGSKVRPKKNLDD